MYILRCLIPKAGLSSEDKEEISNGYFDGNKYISLEAPCRDAKYFVMKDSHMIKNTSLYSTTSMGEILADDHVLTITKLGITFGIKYCGAMKFGMIQDAGCHGYILYENGTMQEVNK